PSCQTRVSLDIRSQIHCRMKFLVLSLFIFMALNNVFSKESELVSFRIPISPIVKKAYEDETRKKNRTLKTVFRYHGIEFVEGCSIALDQERNLITGVLTKAYADILRGYLEILNGMTADEIASGFEKAEQEARMESCHFIPRPNKPVEIR
ncbi:MAG: hypothetical protein AAF733_10610, partial [Verrucomicrobiota bacterium]